MALQHGMGKFARDVAVLGAAFWAADELHLGSLAVGVVSKRSETTHDVSSSKVRHLILKRGISDRVASYANCQGSLSDVSAQLLVFLSGVQ